MLNDRRCLLIVNNLGRFYDEFLWIFLELIESVRSNPSKNLNNIFARQSRFFNQLADQIKQRYGSYQKGMTHDISDAQKQKSEYYLQNEHIDDSMYQ